MAGGTWEFQNKIQPGVYINFRSSPSTLATVGERGIVAIPKELDWNEPGEVVSITSINDVYTKLGYDISDPKVRFIQQMFRGSNRGGGASEVLVYRLGTSGGEKATATYDDLTITAKYAGIKGNSISVIISPDLDTAVSEAEGTLTLTLINGQDSTPLVGATVDLERNVDSNWEQYGDTATTSSGGQVVFNELPIGEYRFTIQTVPAEYDISTISLNPTTIEIQADLGMQDYKVNATIVPTGESQVPATDPGNVTPDPVEGYAVFLVETIVDNVIRDSYTVGRYASPTDYEIATIGMLQNNDWVDFSGTATAYVTATAGVNLAGGINGALTPTAYADALTALEPYTFTILCYDGEDATIKASYATFIQRLGYGDGRYSQFVTSDYHNADEITVISVDNGYELDDGTLLDAAEATWWISGIQASASVSQTMTYAIHPDAVRVNPPLTSDERDAKIQEGSIVFIEEFGQVKILTDINTFTSYEPEKGRIFSKNRTVRVLFNIANDIYRTFSLYYIGTVDNTPVGRNLFKKEIIGYLLQLEGQGAIQNFTADDVEVLPGIDADAIVVNVYIQVVNAVEKVYMSVTVTAEETIV